MQSPVSSAIQQQLQLQLTRHLQPLRPAVQTKAAQKQPEQIKDIDKLVTLLTELNKKYETIRPSCSLSPPSLPPNMNSDIVLRGKKIALEAQAAMRNGVTGKKLEDFIMAMLERERTDITSKPSSSSTSTANTSSPASTSTAKTPCPLTSRTPVASTAPAASSPISISSGPSTPATSSPLARSATSSSACGKAVQVNSTVVASKSPSPVVNAPSTSVAPATPPSTLSPVASPPKAATPSLAAATATASTSTATASLASASSSPEASSSATAAGKKRRKLPAFAMSAFLRTKKEIKSEKKYVKSEGCSSQHRPYPVVEPIEGYDAAIARMIDNMKNEKKGTSSDLWSISSSSSEDEEEDSKSD